MPEWMRSQFMAPVYALLISLSVALVLGAAMNSAGTPVTPGKQQPTVSAAAKPIHLVTETDEPGGPARVAATAQADAPVTIHQASDNGLKVGNDGLVAHISATMRLKVCVQLRDRWKGLDGMPGEKPGEWCWNVDPKDGPFELVIRKGS